MPIIARVPVQCRAFIAFIYHMPAAESDITSTPYHAPFWLPGGHAQTIHAAIWVRRLQVTYWRERWETPDFDFIDLDWVDNPAHELKLDQQDDAPLVVLFYGLEG